MTRTKKATGDAVKLSPWHQAKQDIKAVKLYSIRSVEELEDYSIRQLKALAAKVNREMGMLIGKPMFGMPLSQMDKATLKAAIWYVRSIVMNSPKSDRNWSLVQDAPSIFHMEQEGHSAYGDRWVHYIGFKNDADGATAEQRCYKFLKHVTNKDSNGTDRCAMASMRKADRLRKYGFEWEIKIWKLDENFYKSAVKQNKKAYGATEVAEVVESFVVEHDAVEPAPMPVPIPEPVVPVAPIPEAVPMPTVEVVVEQPVSLTPMTDAILARRKAKQVERKKEEPAAPPATDTEIARLQAMYNGMQNSTAMGIALSSIARSNCHVVDGIVVRKANNE